MEGVEAIVTGKYTKAGDVFALNANVLDVDTKKSIGSVSSRGESEASILRTQIDELSGKIVQGIATGTTEIDTANLNITDITTDSIEAYSFFMKGKEVYEKSYLGDARRYFEKAVEFDPNFASPYLYLVWLYGLEDNQEILVNALEKAKSLSDRASEKDKLYIEAEYANFVEKNPEKFIMLLREIVKRYPREKIIYHHLGDYHWLEGRIREALDEYLLGLELDPEFGMLLYHTALSYLLLEDTDKAAEYLQRHESVAPEDAVVPYLWGGLHLIEGRLDKALSKFNEALEIKPDYPWPIPYVFHIYAMKEEYEEVFQRIDNLIANSSSMLRKVRLHIYRAFFNYWLGNIGGTLDDLNQAEKLCEDTELIEEIPMIEWMKFAVYYAKADYDKSQIHLENFRSRSEKIMSKKILKWTQSNYLCGLGLLNLKSGRINEAESKIAEAQSLNPNIWLGVMNSLQIVQGEILLTKGAYEEAIDISMKLNPNRFPHGGLIWVYVFSLPHYRDLAARTYIRTKNLEKAIMEYEYLVATDPGQNGRWLVHPLYHYRLALLYEQKGWEGKAIDHYEKFLMLWKDADPGIAEVDDARGRMAELTSQ